MGKGKKMARGSFISKHAQNLLNYMPIDDKASALQYKGKKMEESPLHDWGVLQSDMKKSGRKFGDIARGGKGALEGVKKASGNIIKKLDKNIHKISKKEDKDFIRSKRRV